MDVLDILRTQFAVSALFHFIFVPLTIGLLLLSLVMETIYLRTRSAAWGEAARLWSRVFFGNWVIGVITGTVLRWQLSDTWSVYADYAGPVIHSLMGAENILAPFLFALTFAYVFGWRLPARLHWCVTVALTAAMLFQMVSILALNAWMQHPVGVSVTESGITLTALRASFSNPVAIDKIAHTLAASVIAASVFVLTVSAWYLRRRRHVTHALASVRVAVPVGLVAVVMVMVIGHISARDVAVHQPMKFAALEALWHTPLAPAPLTVFALPDATQQTNRYAVEAPYLLSLMGAHDVHQAPLGIDDLVLLAERDIYEASRGVKSAPGMVRLLRRHATDPSSASAEQIHAAALDTVPNVPLLFWSFRLMVGSGLLLAAFFVLWWFARRAGSRLNAWVLRASWVALPLPWLAMGAGWIVAEAGRQPWTIYGVLPTAQSVAAQPAAWWWLVVILLGYSALAVIASAINLRIIRSGPRPLSSRKCSDALGVLPSLHTA